MKKTVWKPAKYEDGTYEICSGGQNETVIVGSVAYTGWKMIGVVPESVQAANYKNFRYYVFATVLVLMVMLLEGNQLVSRKISKPIRELDASVKAHEAGGKPDIYIGGSSEIRHLGHSVQKSYEQIEKLMDEIIRQQKNEEKVNWMPCKARSIRIFSIIRWIPSICWRGSTGEEKTMKMIQALSKYLRLSLSKGREIVTVEDELENVKSYMEIQQIRNENLFRYEIECGEELKTRWILKLILQPIVENAVKYGFCDIFEGGLIRISVTEQAGQLTFSVYNNGTPMEEQMAEKLNGLSEIPVSKMKDS